MAADPPRTPIRELNERLKQLREEIQQVRAERNTLRDALKAESDKK